MSIDIIALADRLWEAQQEGTPCAPLTEDEPELDVAQAYAIQRINLDRRGSRRVGYKIGLTSPSIQQWLGVDQPDFGGLTADMIIPTGGAAPTNRLLQGRAEAEIAFILGDDLDEGPCTVADVLMATEYILPAIEIVDSRIADWKITYADTIADNASSGMFVLGSDPAPLKGARLELAGMTLRKNGEVVSTGAGAACMGHPINALVWLANTMAERGTPLEAGHIILSGALGPVCEVARGDALTASIARVGDVSVRFI